MSVIPNYAGLPLQASLDKKKKKKKSSQEKKLSVMAHTCHPSYLEKHKIGLQSSPAWTQSEILSPK
jgi:hypothetical protein